MKKLLGIVVLGLLLSGNAYAIKLNKCYWAELPEDQKEHEVTKFNDQRYEDVFIEINITSKQVRKTFILTDWGVRDALVQLNKSNKIFNMPEETFHEKIWFSTYDITFISERYVKAEKNYLSIGKTTIEIDLKNFRMRMLSDSSGTSIMQCESSSGSSSSSDVASSGSGFFINNKGYFVTNNHVVKECKQSKITFKEEEVDAELIATDETLDLALLRAKVKPKDYLNISDEPPEKMQKVFVAGYPFGKGLSDDLKFTQGIISAVKGLADNSNQIQLDAAINFGNSGGPIVNEDGDLVAVAVSSLDKSQSEGIGFGIKASSVINFLEVNNIKYSLPSLINFGMSNKKLNKLMEASTVYTFCN